MRMVTVLHPKYESDPRNNKVPELTDYISVPHIDTIGGWRIHEMLSLTEIKALADLANRLERERKMAPRKGMRDTGVRWRA